jgi:hypothetical protein
MMAPKKHNENEERIEIKGQEEGRTLFSRLIDSGLDLLIHTSEDGGKTTIKPFALPKEVISYLFGQIDRTKSDIVSLFGREFKRFLEATDLSEEVVKAMSQMSVEVKAQISFKRNGGKGEVHVETTVSDETVQEKPAKPGKGSGKGR